MVYPNNKKSVYNRLKQIFEKIGIKTDSFAAETEQDDCPTSLLYEKLRQSTHVVLLLSKETLQRRWFVFSVGYTLAKEETAFLFIEDKIPDPPEYLKGFLWLRAFEMVEEYFTREAHRYEKERAVKEAKGALIEQGIPVTKEALVQCVEKGDIRSLEHFLTAGFSPNIKNEKGMPLLSIAVRTGTEEIVGMLLERGADVNAPSEDNGNTPLIDAASKGNEKLFNILIEAGAEPDMQSKNGQTALMLTIGQGETKLAEYLIKAGADVTITDKLGMSAYKYAELFKYDKIISLIKQTTNA